MDIQNGDAGQQYLSIVYVNGIRKQWLFYPDYIIKTKDNNVWIIETKGGMEADHSKISIARLKTSSMRLNRMLKDISSIGALCVISTKNYI